MRILTRNLGGGGECLSKLRVHLDDLRLGVDERLVPDLDLLVHPRRELRGEDRVDHVDEPLLRHLLDLVSIWNVCEDWRELRAESSNIIQSKTLVSRHSDEFDVLALDVCIK